MVMMKDDDNDDDDYLYNGGSGYDDDHHKDNDMIRKMMMITSIMVAGQRALQTGQCPKHKAEYNLLVTVVMMKKSNKNNDAIKPTRSC